jgi:hypothetical protein
VSDARRLTVYQNGKTFFGILDTTARVALFAVSLLLRTLPQTLTVLGKLKLIEELQHGLGLLSTFTLDRESPFEESIASGWNSVNEAKLSCLAYTDPPALQYLARTTHQILYPQLATIVHFNPMQFGMFRLIGRKGCKLRDFRSRMVVRSIQTTSFRVYPPFTSKREEDPTRSFYADSHRIRCTMCEPISGNEAATTTSLPR